MHDDERFPVPGFVSGARRAAVTDICRAGHEPELRVGGLQHPAALEGLTSIQDHIEKVPVPPPLKLDPLMLPEPLPDEEDDPDIDPEVENEDDPLDLLPDDEPLLDEPLLDPDIDPDPEPLPEPEPDPDDALPEPELWAVAGMSL